MAVVPKRTIRVQVIDNSKVSENAIRAAILALHRSTYLVRHQLVTMYSCIEIPFSRCAKQCLNVRAIIL